MIYDKEQFSEAIKLFMNFNPVKVKRDLKDEFHNALSKHFISIEARGWSATMIPLVKSWKFVRTNEYLNKREY